MQCVNTATGNSMHIVVNILAMHLWGYGFDSCLRPVCIEFTPFPPGGGFLWVLRFVGWLPELN